MPGTVLSTRDTRLRNIGYRNVNRRLQYRMMHANADVYTGNRKSHGDVMGK